MDKISYLFYAIQQDYLSNIDFLYQILTIPTKDSFKSQYFKYDNNTLYAYVNDQSVLIDDYIPEHPLFTIKDVIKFPKNIISLLQEDTISTLGIFITNYILIYKPFHTKLQYKNGPLDIGKLENLIGELMMDDTITVRQYKTFVDCAQYIEQLSDIVTVSATAQSMVPPPGLREYKKKLREEFDKKYGEEWNKDQVLIVEYETHLKNYLKDYLKNDPAYGKLMGGKVLNNSWAKKFLTFGAEAGFDATDVQQVDNSLMDGLPKDKAQITKMFNTTRSASYSRGAETVLGGVTAKYLLRATSAYVIEDKDCKVTYGEYYDITEDIYKILKGRYIIVNKKPVLIKSEEEAKKYIGKRVEVRSPKYCKSNGTKICKICAGEFMSLNKDGINLAVTNISETILTASLKKMHNSQLSAVSINIQDVIM